MTILLHIQIDNYDDLLICTYLQVTMQDIVRVQVVYSQYQLSEPFKQYLSVIQSYEHNVDDSLPSIGQTQCQTAPT